MDLALIKTFIEVSETGSFVAASERLFVTQSAVSLRVQRLEELLGHPLFLRSKSGVELTHSGRRSLPHAFVSHPWVLTRYTQSSLLALGAPQRPEYPTYYRAGPNGIAPAGIGNRPPGCLPPVPE